MIPSFPQFKNLEISDREEIQKIASSFLPYSDFDFASLWSWNIYGLFKVSKLNGNLVVILTDHFTNELFYSFIGNHKVNETIKQLFAFPISNQRTPTLKLIPEECLKGVDFDKFIIEIDLSNYDYIYDAHEHSTFSGAKYSSKRKLYNRFVRSYPNHSIVLTEINEKLKGSIMELSRVWVESKAQAEIAFDWGKELLALKRFLDCNDPRALVVAVHENDKLIGFDLVTISHGNYAISHFSKTDVKYVGIYEYLVGRGSALLAQEKGIQFVNAEEDLGLPSLRYSKNSYRPVKFLQKYIINER